LTFTGAETGFVGLGSLTPADTSSAAADSKRW
jgi:hypothetical protein